MKIWTKIAKLQMHENLHKNVNKHIFMQIFMSFYDGQLSNKYVTAFICYSFYTANFLYGF